MNRILFFVIAVFVFCCVGCSYNPGPNSTGPGKTIPAKPGSTYTFKHVGTDTTGKPIDSTAYYSRDSVVATGLDTLGKTNVTHFVTVDTLYGFPYNNTYINFEPDGDISLYSTTGGLGGVTLPNWRTYPMQSHSTIGMKIGDTTVIFPGIPLPIPIKVFDSIFYVNNSTYSVGNIPVFNSKDVLTINATVLFAPVIFVTTRHISFAPSLGYIISDITDPTKSPIGAIPSFPGREMTLVSYTLK
jgi:hypothetical protein